MKPVRPVFAVVAALALLPLLSLRAQAADPVAFPTQPLRLVVPADAGSRDDVLARSLASGLAARLGHPVRVDNVADRAVAFAAVAGAVPDGHTLLLGGESLLAGLAQPHVAYELKSYTPVALATRSAQVPVAGFLPAAPASATVAGVQGVLAPAGTAGVVVRRLHEAITQALGDPSTRATLSAAGFEVVAGSPAAYSAELLRGLGSWTRIARASAPLAP